LLVEAAAIGAAILIARPASAGQGCASRRMTVVGSFCMDRYEASVWRIPASARDLVKKARSGKPTQAELTAGGATQLGVNGDDYAQCADDGNTGCDDIYAVSVDGVFPSANLTWFQAQRACVNSGKRLPRNSEWQATVSGTPDSRSDNGATNCNTTSADAVVRTGSRSGCISRFGNFDMVGNVDEWVEDWMPASTACPGWGGFSNDYMCLAGASTTATGPGALLRSGGFKDGALAGPLAVISHEPSNSFNDFGFRCAR
jgi:formylglycine-generating enzyme required for sulfatase activity